jgi:lysophospholipase L1-like esterase
MSPTPKHRARTTILVVLFWVVVFLAASEFMLRQLCSYCTWTESNNGRFESPYAINENSWYLLSKKNSIENYNQAEFDYEIRTNSLGFRDVEHPVAKAPGEYRILAVGDSFTEGQGAPFDQTGLSVLDRNLNHLDDTHRYRVMVAGVAGSDPFYEYRILVDKLLVYQPDLVMMITNGSDVIDVLRRGGEERFLADGRVKGVEPPAPKLAWLYEHSHFARLVLSEAFDYTYLLVTKSERGRRVVAAQEKMTALILKLDGLLRDQGIEFVLVVLPDKREVDRDTYGDLRNLQGLVDFCRSNGVATIEVKPYFVEQLTNGNSELDALYWAKDFHFTPLGYRYMGEAIQQGLCKLKPDMAQQFCPDSD